MTRAWWWALAGSLSLWLLTAVWSTRSIAEAQQAYESARARFLATASDVQELRSLQAVRAEVPDQRRPDRGLVESIREALRAAGIGEQAFVGIQHQDDRPLENSSVRVQRVSLRLRDLRVPELGALLRAWRGEGNPWRVTAGRLTADRQGRGGYYEVQLILAAPYLPLGAEELPAPAPERGEGAP